MKLTNNSKAAFLALALLLGGGAVAVANSNPVITNSEPQSASVRVVEALVGEDITSMETRGKGVWEEGDYEADYFNYTVNQVELIGVKMNHIVDDQGIGGFLTLRADGTGEYTVDDVEYPQITFGTWKKLPSGKVVFNSYDGNVRAEFTNLVAFND